MKSKKWHVIPVFSLASADLHWFATNWKEKNPHTFDPLIEHSTLSPPPVPD